MPGLAKKKSSFQSGIQVPDSIEFRGWQPGFEYTKNINLKNLNSKNIRISYEIPKTRFFATIYPKLITLSPGTSFNLPVTFKPLDLCLYEDVINFQIHETHHSFRIPLNGLIPTLDIDLPNKLDLGLCISHESTCHDFKLNNQSELSTIFEFDVKEPFAITPSSGVLGPKSSLIIKCLFNPEQAMVYKCTVVCKYGKMGEDLNAFKLMELNAISKYPHFLLEENNVKVNDVQLQFDDTPAGKTSTKYVSIVNMLPIKSSFFIERASSIPNFDISFNCLQENGILQPFEQYKIPISFTPNLTSTSFYDYFHVYSAGKKTKNIIACKGYCVSSNVQLSTKSIDFGHFEVTKESTKTFTIENLSNHEVAYQFDVDNEFGAFVFSTTNGILKPCESALIKVTLKPQFAIIFYKKVACLVQNQDVKFIELYGTVYSEIVKPPILNLKNIRIYHKLLKKGLSINSPDQLREMNLLDVMNDTKVDDQNVDSNERFNVYFSLDTDKHIQVDTKYLDFELSPVTSNDTNTSPQQEEQKSITLFNNTKGKVIICWNSNEQSVFSINPKQCEISPNKSYSFRVSFQPHLAGQFYACSLEGYALYKSLSDYTVANNENYILPSWCINIKCVASTFHKLEEKFFPRYSIENDSLVFPTSSAMNIYKTLLIRNTADKYPLYYDLSQVSNTLDWCVTPLKGLLKPHEHQIFLFKFTPKQDYHVERCLVKLNRSDSHIFDILLFANVEIPRLRLPNDGIIYFKPTCKGNTTYQTYEIINDTRSVVNYEWKLGLECKDLFSVSHVKGILQPYEKCETFWKFTPKQIEKFNMKVGLQVSIGDKIRLLSVRLMSSCTSGTLSVNESYKDLGNVVVGSSETSEVTLINNNSCSLDYELYVMQTVDTSSANAFKNDPCILELDDLKGSLEARSRKTIRFRIRPVRVISYQFSLSYKIIYPNEKDKFDAPIEHLCHMSVNGVYPKLSIIDVKASGSAANLSKDYLWKLFSIDALNSSMNCEPNADELMYSISTRQDTHRRLVNKPKVVLDFNFNAAPVKSADSELVLFIKNTGLVATDWHLMFPKDLQIELEYWSQNGLFDEDELNEMKVQDNKLFVCKPKSSRLEPGDTCQLKLNYCHLFTGTNKLPVLLKISRGREIMLNFIGVTVPLNMPYLYFATNKFSFDPVQIGLTEYPVQTYELYNGGDSVAKVFIDTSQLDHSISGNYGHRVVECLSEREIEIAPGTSYLTKWKFSPLEAKTYTTDVAFKLDGEENNFITFTCTGYDSRKVNPLRNNENDQIPARQLFTLNNQLASLTLERVLIGDIPLFSRERRFVFIKNHSSEHKVAFNWHVTNLEYVRYIRVQPSRGTIGTNESKLCKVTFIARDVPEFYNIDLICEIKNETDTSRYHEELDAWKKEQKRQWSEFKIDDNELENRLKQAQSPQKSTRIDSQLSIHTFKTIPPILTDPTLNETAITKARRVRNEKKIWRKPEPPAPHLLHLNVIARTHFSHDYYQNKQKSQHESDKFIDSLLGNTIDPKPDTTSELFEQISATNDEAETVKVVLTDILRSLVSDKTFEMLVQDIKSEPIPYFLQYTQKQVASYQQHSRKSVDPSTNDDKKSSSLSQEEPQQLVTFTTKPLDTNRSSKFYEKSELVENSQIKLSEIYPSKSKRSETEQFEMTQKIKTTPMFGSFIETILDNTITNVIMEAFNNEFSLTNRPRLIALPPKPTQKQTTETTSEATPSITIRSPTQLIKN